jgi:hypothetical protein
LREQPVIPILQELWPTLGLWRDRSKMVNLLQILVQTSDKIFNLPISVLLVDLVVEVGSLGHPAVLAG